MDIFLPLAGQNSLYAAGSQLLGASVRIGAASASTSDNTDYVHSDDQVWQGVTPYDSLDQVWVGMTVPSRRLPMPTQADARAVPGTRRRAVGRPADADDRAGVDETARCANNATVVCALNVYFFLPLAGAGKAPRRRDRGARRRRISLFLNVRPAVAHRCEQWAGRRHDT
jgi:hypothetical protein